MRSILSIGLALAAATPALAAPQDPVRVVLAAASHNWEPGITEIDDYFSDERLDTIYSTSLAKAFREAAEAAAANDDGIWEMDFLVNAQSACKFEDIKLEDKPAADGVTPVDASFHAFRCLTNGEDTTRVSHLVFKVKTENGHDVIDDILRVDEDGKQHSMRQEIDSYPR